MIVDRQLIRRWGFNRFDRVCVIFVGSFFEDCFCVVLVFFYQKFGKANLNIKTKKFSCHKKNIRKRKMKKK